MHLSFSSLSLCPASLSLSSRFLLLLPSSVFTKKLMRVIRVGFVSAIEKGYDFLDPTRWLKELVGSETSFIFYEICILESSNSIKKVEGGDTFGDLCPFRLFLPSTSASFRFSPPPPQACPSVLILLPFFIPPFPSPPCAPPLPFILAFVRCSPPPSFHILISLFLSPFLSLLPHPNILFPSD